MPDNESIPSPRAKRRASARARREASAATRQVVFEALTAGWSVEQIAEMRKVSARTVRREVDRTLAERRLDAPERFAHLQVARLNKALRLADAAMEEGNLKAVAAIVNVVRELDRYHGIKWSMGATLPPPAAGWPLPAPPLKLTRSAPPMTDQFLVEAAVAATPSRDSSGETQGVSAAPVSEAGLAESESDFVTRLDAEAAEIMGAAPDARHASPGQGEDASPRVALSDSDADENKSVTGFDGQALEVMGSAPGLQGVAAQRCERSDPDPSTSGAKAEAPAGPAVDAAPGFLWEERPRLAFPLIGSAS